MKIRLLILGALLAWSTSASAIVIGYSVEYVDEYGLYNPLGLNEGDFVDLEMYTEYNHDGTTFEDIAITSLTLIANSFRYAITGAFDATFNAGYLIGIGGYGDILDAYFDSFGTSFDIWDEAGDPNGDDADNSFVYYTLTAEGEFPLDGLDTAGVPVAVPEPGTLGLLGLGLVMLGLRRRMART